MGTRTFDRHLLNANPSQDHALPSPCGVQCSIAFRVLNPARSVVSIRRGGRRTLSEHVSCKLTAAAGPLYMFRGDTTFIC